MIEQTGGQRKTAFAAAIRFAAALFAVQAAFDQAADPALLGEFVLPAQALKGGHRVSKQGFVFPHGRYVSIRQTRQIHYTRLALVDPKRVFE